MTINETNKMIAPGPWSTDPHGTGEMGSVYDADGHMVCQAQPSQHFVDNLRAQNMARHATAEALCAYPDLRAALERAVAHIEDQDTGIIEWARRSRSVLVEARTALSRGR